MPGIPAAAMSARNGEPPVRWVYQRRVSRWPLGSLPDVRPRPRASLHEPFSDQEPDGLDRYPVGHVILPGQFMPGGYLRAGRKHAVHDRAAEVIRDALVRGSGHANKLDELEYSGAS